MNKREKCTKLFFHVKDGNYDKQQTNWFYRFWCWWVDGRQRSNQALPNESILYLEIQPDARMVRPAEQVIEYTWQMTRFY